MCQFCDFGNRGKFNGRTPDFLILQDRFALKIEKDEPYVGDYGLTVNDNEDECEFTVAINFCPMCGRKLTEKKKSEDAEKLKEFLFKIIDEHKFACRKHPNFCNALIDPDSRVSWAESKSRIKARNAITNEYADNILMEEMAEAFAVYQHGDKAQALQKFAQCGAVILRIMEFVEGES